MLVVVDVGELSVCLLAFIALCTCGVLEFFRNFNTKSNKVINVIFRLGDDILYTPIYQLITLAF